MNTNCKYSSLSNDWIADQLAKAKYVKPKHENEFEGCGLWDWREENEEDAKVDEITTFVDESEFDAEEAEEENDEEDDGKRFGPVARVLFSPMQLPARLQECSSLSPLGDASRPKQKSMSFWCNLVTAAASAAAAASKASKKRTRQRRKKGKAAMADPEPTQVSVQPAAAPSAAPSPSVPLAPPKAEPIRAWIKMETVHLVPIDLAHPEQDRLVIEQEREWQRVEAQKKKEAEIPPMQFKPKWCSSTRADMICQKRNCNAKHDLNGILEGTNWCHFGNKCRRVAWSTAERRLVNSLRPHQNPCRFKHERESEFSFKRRCFLVLLREEARRMRFNVVGHNDGVTLISAAPNEMAEVSFAAAQVYGRGRFRVLRRLVNSSQAQPKFKHLDLERFPK